MLAWGKWYNICLQVQYQAYRHSTRGRLWKFPFTWWNPIYPIMCNLEHSSHMQTRLWKPLCLLTPCSFPTQVKNNHTLLCVPAMLSSCLIIAVVIVADIKGVSVFVHSCVCVLCVHMSFMCTDMCRCPTIFLLNEELLRIQPIFDSCHIFVGLYGADIVKC